MGKACLGVSFRCLKPLGPGWVARVIIEREEDVRVGCVAVREEGLAALTP